MKENRYLEYKQEINDKFLKTVSAFANYEGGDIVFGISDTGKIVDLKELDILCLSIENKINDSIEPKPDFTITTDRKNNTIKLHVFRGYNTPYLYRNKAYKRNDTATVEVDNTELKRLILHGENKNFEELISDKQELTFTYLENELRDVLNIKSLNKDILKTLSLYSDSEGYNIAAQILSDQNSFPGIDAARFGEDLNIILDRETSTKCSVLKMFNDTFTMFEKYYSYEKINEARREKKYLIPPAAFREALANAIVHRLWDVKTDIRVAMFADRVEVFSPGGLPRDISKDEYLSGQVSILRNPIISNVFFRLNIIETFGTGIIKIKRAYENVSAKPRFDIFENSISVILPIYESATPITTDEEKIVGLIRRGHLVSSSEVAAFTGFSKAKTVQLLKSLLEKKMIVKIGNGRGTKYRLE